jgi:hypothetical protein
MRSASNNQPDHLISISNAHNMENTTINMAKTKEVGSKDKEKKKSPPFKQDSKEFKMLVKLFQNGKIKPSEQPAAVRSKYVDTFGKYTATQFRSQYSKARNFAGCNRKYPFNMATCTVNCYHLLTLYYSYQSCR